MIVRELEAILALDARELGVRQPRLELVEACLCQTTCGLRTPAHSLITDHRRTLAPTAARRHSSYARAPSQFPSHSPAFALVRRGPAHGRVPAVSRP